MNEDKQWIYNHRHKWIFGKLQAFYYWWVTYTPEANWLWHRLPKGKRALGLTYDIWDQAPAWELYCAGSSSSKSISGSAQRRLVMRHDSQTQMKAYPVVILQDRYGGVYSGGAWLAIAEGTRDGSPATYLRRAYYSNELPPYSRFAEVLHYAHAEDTGTMDFRLLSWVGVGDTPDAALEDLYRKLEEEAHA